MIHRLLRFHRLEGTARRVFSYLCNLWNLWMNSEVFSKLASLQRLVRSGHRLDEDADASCIRAARVSRRMDLRRHGGRPTPGERTGPPLGPLRSHPGNGLASAATNFQPRAKKVYENRACLQVRARGTRGRQTRRARATRGNRSRPRSTWPAGVHFNKRPHAFPAPSPSQASFKGMIQRGATRDLLHYFKP